MYVCGAESREVKVRYVFFLLKMDEYPKGEFTTTSKQSCALATMYMI